MLIHTYYNFIQYRPNVYNLIILPSGKVVISLVFAECILIDSLGN